MAASLSCRRALLEGRFETALRDLRRGTRSLGSRPGRGTEIQALWKAARGLLRATRRISGNVHLARHRRKKPARRVIEAAQFDAGTLLEVSAGRLSVQKAGRRWIRRALRELAGHEDPHAAWSRFVHLAIRLTRADCGALVEARKDELRILATSDAQGVPLPRPLTPIHEGAVRSCIRRQRERMPGGRLPDGGRRLVVPVPDGDGTPLALVLARLGRAPRFGEERRLVLRAYAQRAGSQAAAAGRRLTARASEEERRREERRIRRERAQARARQRRYLRSLREARQGEERVRATLRYGYEHIVGAGGRMGEILRSLDRVVPTDLPLLLLGETGTGKELVARAIHEHSPRREGPFVTVNAAALPESLVETELFGCRRGAYTGADQDRTGRLREADRGTFFLDEVGEMTRSAQAKLLRVLESASVRPVGGRRDHPTDVRLIAATNRDLRVLVAEGRFREDLYHRLRVVPIELPSLRERLDDLPLLVEHFLRAHSRGVPPAVSDEALAHLRAHTWPGNIRELEMCLRVALVLCDGPKLLERHVRIQPVPGLSVDPVARVPDGLSQRQRRLLEEWPEAEPISCAAYVKRFGLSSRTASRDLADLTRRGVLDRRGAGASTSYIRRVEP